MFWRLSLREYAALMNRYRIHQEWLDFRTGLLCSTIVNVNNPKRTYTPADFMPLPCEPRASRRMSDAEMEQAARSINARLGGTQVEL
jgi:hypothetical protein